jgi:DNA-binding SARP family transcriptional activator
MGQPDGVLPVRIALLGTPLVTSTDAAVVYPLPRKTLDVLAYLLLNRGRTMPRSSVAFALFPDDEEELARGSLRRNLSYLLSALPEAPAKTPFVLTDGKTIAWNAQAPAIVDVDEFERAITEHRDDDAIGLYVGELLPTLYADWTTAERERLRSRVLCCTRTLGGKISFDCSSPFGTKRATAAAPLPSTSVSHRGSERRCAPNQCPRLLRFARP